jgi:hypothetical protein
MESGSLYRQIGFTTILDDRRFPSPAREVLWLWKDLAESVTVKEHYRPVSVRLSKMNLHRQHYDLGGTLNDGSSRNTRGTYPRAVTLGRLSALYRL